MTKHFYEKEENVRPKLFGNINIEKYREKMRLNLEETTRIISAHKVELLSECGSIHEADFRENWLHLFFGETEPNMSLWINNVAGTGHLPVNIVNSSGEILCTMPPLFAPKGNTITKSRAKESNLHQVMQTARARADTIPTRREEIIIDAMMPYIDMAHTDSKWVKEWVKLCMYFEIPKEKWLVKNDTDNILSDSKTTKTSNRSIPVLSFAEEADDVYDEFDEL